MPEKVGLTAVLSFLGDKAITGMQRVGSAFRGMAASASVAKAGVADLKAGFAGMGAATMALTAAGVGTIKKFTDFERQFGAVKAVLGEQANKFFPDLRARAEELGATTSFTAVQAAEAMENLARAGFAPNEILGAIGNTLAAAAAEGMDLGTAADIVASNMKAFGLEAKDAGRIADTLAFVSAKTNTNMVGLQEGLKFAAPIARSLGIELEDTAATMGLLADVGLKGSLAGTGFKNALLKLSKEAKKGRVKVAGLNVEIVNARDEFGKIVGLNLPETMMNVVRALSGIRSPTERAAAGMKLLGLRGIGAATAFEALTEEKAELMFRRLREESVGAASSMAKMRLENIHGDFVRLTSAIEGASIKLGSVLAPTAREAFSGLTTFFSDTAAAFTALASGQESDLKKLNRTSVEFARGFKEGFQGAKNVLLGFVGVVKRIAGGIAALLGQKGMLGEDGPGVRGTTAFVMKFAAFAVGLKVTTGLLSRFSRVAVGTFKLVSGAIGTAKAGLMGTVTLLSKRIPALRKIPGVAGRLARLAGAAEKVTAQPVRVVNFDEAGLGGMGGPLGGPAGAEAPGQGGGGGKSFFGTKVGKGMFKGMSKAGVGLTALGGAAAVAGSAIAGWQIGRAVDETFGLSDSISDLARTNKVATALSNERVQAHERELRATRAAEAIGTYGRMARAQGGFGFINRGRGRREALTRELAQEEIRKKFLQAGGRLEELPSLLAAIRPMLEEIPSKEDFMRAGKPLEVKLVLDGKVVAKSTTTSVTDIVKRGGKFKHAPGTNREKHMGLPFTPID